MVRPEATWIDDALEEKWVRMIGFCSVLVREYADIDRRLVFTFYSTTWAISGASVLSLLVFSDIRLTK